VNLIFALMRLNVNYYKIKWC